jgi:hypothetical protein
MAMSDGRDLSSAAKVLITIGMRLLREVEKEGSDNESHRDLRPRVDGRPD